MPWGILGGEVIVELATIGGCSQFRPGLTSPCSLCRSLSRPRPDVCHLGYVVQLVSRETTAPSSMRFGSIVFARPWRGVCAMPVWLRPERG